ncbi:hypothetical protein [Streptomyces sp. Tue6028]
MEDGQDASTIRIGHGPENTATLRSFAISTLRTEAVVMQHAVGR